MKDHILAVAEEIFAIKGFAATTTREIAAKSTANKNLIFYYFGSKANLYTSILEKNIAPVIDSLLQILSEEGKLDNKIDSIIETYYEAFARNSAILPSLMARELAAGAPFFKTFIAGRIDTIKPVLSVAFQTEENSFSTYFKLTNIIAVTLFSFLMRPVREMIADHVHIPPPGDDYVRDQIRQFTKFGVLV
ncbi:MAG: TetR/AcrR family transcriptional regulator [FCB group bacterium]|nr:TetR/AcrR family transcriptional regulator [FCB group bacterium]